MFVRRLAWLVTLLGLFALAACGGDDDDAPREGEERLVTVASEDSLQFEPSEFRVQVGETVVLTLDNESGATLHDLSVADMPVRDVHAEGSAQEHGHDAQERMAALHVAAEPGHRPTQRFTATEAGEFAFYCSVAGHAEGGMVGRIIVEP